MLIPYNPAPAGFFLLIYSPRSQIGVVKEV